MLCLNHFVIIISSYVLFADSHVTMGTDDLQSGNQKLKPSETKTDEISQHPQGKGVHCTAHYTQLQHCDKYGYPTHAYVHVHMF